MNRRKGSDPRGKASDHRKRKLKLLHRYGDGDTCPCVHCGKGLNFETLTQDRIIPGGSYRIDNVQPSCLSCNMRRGDSPITPFPAA